MKTKTEIIDGIKIETVVNENGYKIFKVKISNIDTFFRCSSHCVSTGYDVDQVVYDLKHDDYNFEANCYWVQNIKECKNSLVEWALNTK